MKKIGKIVLMTMISFMLLLPVSLGNLNSGSFLSFADAKSSKVNKKTKDKKKKDTEQRIKRLKSLGISKDFYSDSYGSSMSLQEMGSIVGKWIVAEYARTGQIPSLSEENSDWLVLRVNGQCLASDKACARWNE